MLFYCTPMIWIDMRDSRPSKLRELGHGSEVEW